MPKGKISAVVLMGLAVIAFALALGKGMLPLEATYSVLLTSFGAIAAYLITLKGVTHQLGGVSGDLAGCSLTIAEAFAIMVLALIS